jgi:hypothetical protein
MIEERLGERVPDFVPHILARKLPGGFFHFVPEFGVTLRPSRETDDSHRWWQFAIGGEIIKSRDELAMSQVPRRSKNDNAAWLGNSTR